MIEMSKKAKIVYGALDMLQARSIENAVTSFALADFIGENEDLQNHEYVKDIEEEDFVNMIMEMNIKSIAGILNGLYKNGIINKTEPMSMKVNGANKILRKYFLVK